MKRILVCASLVVAALCGWAAYSATTQEAVVTGLSGYQEVPPISTAAVGVFNGNIDATETSISYTLTYQGLSSAPSMAHLHFGQRGVNGGVVAFLCGGGGKPACPSSGSVSGTITAADIQAVPTQGIAAGELAEVIRAIRAGAVYANVHTANFGSGEIRGQLRPM